MKGYGLSVARRLGSDKSTPKNLSGRVQQSALTIGFRIPDHAARVTPDR